MLSLLQLLQRLIKMGSVVSSQSPMDHLLHPADLEGRASASDTLLPAITSPHVDAEGGSEVVESDSDEDDDSTEGDGEEGKVSSERTPEGIGGSEAGNDKATPPLTEYIINVVHFLDAILSNNSTDDHMREFIGQGGMHPLLMLLSLPVLPLDFPTSAACTAITGACRSIMVRRGVGERVGWGVRCAWKERVGWGGSSGVDSGT